MTDRRVWDYETLKHYDHVRAHFKDTDKTVWVTMLYGSQNYGLESADSDVDTKTMLLPGLRSLARGEKPVSMELVLPDGSLDNCKDLREMFQNYLKGNINFVETLYTPHYCVHDDYYAFFEDLQEHRDLVANARPVKLVHMAGGMAEQKYAAFDKVFEGKKQVLAQYGYDPKQLHHQQRLYHFVKEYLTSMNFERALLCCNKSVHYERYTTLMNLKTKPLPVKEARELREYLRAETKAMVDSAAKVLPEDNGFAEAQAYLEDLAYRVMRRYLRDSVSD